MSIIAGAMQGIGQGVAEIGKTAVAAQFEIEKEQRLNAIKEKWYAREREDKRADLVEQRDYTEGQAAKARADAISDYGAKKAIDEGYAAEEKAAIADLRKAQAEYYRDRVGVSAGGTGGGRSNKSSWDDVTSEFGERDVKALRETGKRADGSDLGADYKLVNGQIMIDRTSNPDKAPTKAQLDGLHGKGIIGSQMEVKNMTELTELKRMIDMSADPDEKASLTDMYRRALGTSGGSSRLQTLPPALN